MPVIQAKAGDIKYFGRLTSSSPQFTGYNAALAGAAALSALNLNAPIQIGLVQFMVTQNPPRAPVTTFGLPVIALAGNGVPLYICDLAAAASATFDQALRNSYNLSRNNPTIPLSFARLIQVVSFP